MSVFIDGDIVLYSVGFAAQKRWYRDAEGGAWPTVSAAKEGGRDKDELELVIEPDPFSYAAHSARLVVSAIEIATSKKATIVFSGTSNFRKDMATIYPYKGDRSSEKPYHYSGLRLYLRSWPHVITDGIEADDYMGMMLQVKDNVIATLDKDLDMVPGVHYNWKKELLYNVTEEEGMYNFFNQVLQGDKIDSIKGPKGIGPIRAKKILGSTRKWYDAAYSTYYEYISKTSDVTDKTEREALAEYWLHENMSLLWIQRKPNDRWQDHKRWMQEPYAKED